MKIEYGSGWYGDFQKYKKIQAWKNSLLFIWIGQSCKHLNVLYYLFFPSLYYYFWKFVLKLRWTLHHQWPHVSQCLQSCTGSWPIGLSNLVGLYVVEIWKRLYCNVNAIFIIAENLTTSTVQSKITHWLHESQSKPCNEPWSRMWVS